jgi:hypothetical protein
MMKAVPLLLVGCPTFGLHVKTATECVLLASVRAAGVCVPGVRPGLPRTTDHEPRGGGFGAAGIALLFVNPA